MKGNIRYKNFSKLVREGKPEYKLEKKKNKISFLRGVGNFCY